jgi:alpha-beta hydrolase superfamily lysophospholipase
MTKILIYVFWLIAFTNCYSINPSREYLYTPDSLALKYEEIIIQTKDGYQINTWFYQPDSAKNNSTTLILAYGDSGNMSNFVFHVNSLIKSGFSVVTFDYRGFGKSSDFQIKKDYLYHPEFVDDLVAVVNFVQKKREGNKIGIWALSMGSIITTIGIGQKKMKVDFLILESSIFSIKKHAERLLLEKNKNVVLPENSQKYSRYIKKVKNVPKLIFAATEDKITTVDDAIKYKKSRKKICHIVIYKGQHLRGFQSLSENSFGDRYISEISNFIGQN